jgi:ferredoxin
MRVVVDQDLCCASGQCVVAVPEVFDHSADDGVVVVLQPEPPARLWGKVRDAAARCPSSCIEVVESPPGPD